MSGYSEKRTLRYFKKGAEVEICSDDDGFRGSLYAGTVIHPPKTVSSKVVVEYKTLMADEEGTRPLRESLNLVQLRPPPPQENRHVFNTMEDVDAYHNDGWWEGIITEKFKEGNVDKYKVFFRGTREQIDFDASQLRLHREWVYGEWKPPVDPSLEPVANVNRTPSPAEVEANTEVTDREFKRLKRTLSLSPSPSPAEVEANKEVTEHEFMRTPSPAEVEANKEVIEHEFNPGDLVEASSNEEGFEGAWFVGTVVEKTTAGKYLIEYQKLRNDDDTDFLSEEVDKVYLRPCPPEVGSIDGFALHDKVDAMHNDGWWAGEIRKILKNDRYCVYFQDSNEELKFEHSDLRVRQEWRNGEWHIAS